MTAQAQTPTARVSLTGVVTGPDQEPLAGVTISVPGRADNTRTDARGLFRLELPRGRYVLRATYPGYAPLSVTAELPLADTLRLRLVPAAETQLAAVVVSTGYQDLPKERATGSFVKVDETLLNRSVSTDVLARLQDVTPGVSFNRVGTRISVRGQSTLKANADPLIVVDGFPYNQPIETLNPNDVESISVLKDAAAASIWGARAGNGVIVVTTKKGSYNQAPKVSLNANVTVGERPDQFYLPRMSTADYVATEQRLFREGFYAARERADNNPALSPVVELLVAARDGKLTAANAGAQIASLTTQDVRNDISRYLYRPLINQQYSLGITGGSANNRYNFSAGHDRNLDSQQGNGFERITLDAGNTWSWLNRKLELSTNLYLTSSDRQANSPGTLTWASGQRLYPYARLADESGMPLSVTRDLRNSFIQAAQQRGLLDWSYIPLNELSLADNHTRITNYRLSSGLKYRLPFGMSAQVQYLYEASQTRGRNAQTQQSYYVRNLINQFTQVSTSGAITRPVPLGGVTDFSNGNTANHDLRAQLNYDLEKGPHQLSAIAGYEIQSLRTQGNAYRFYGYDAEHATGRPVDNVTVFSRYDYPASTGTIPYGASESDLTDHYISWYGNAAYTYDGKYTVSGSARLDRSNLFGVDFNNKGVPLWSAGLLWNAARENFYHLEWLPELRLRATLGYNGNLSKSLSAYTTAGYFNGSDSQTLLPYANIVNPPNPDLRWERIRNLNFGLDFATRNRRLSGTLEYFVKRGLDLIGSTAYAASTGIRVFTGNTAESAGHGLDLSLESRNITGKLGWTTNFFISYITDKVTRFDQQSLSSLYLSEGALGNFPLQGKPLFAIYSYRWAGLDPANGDPQGYLNGAFSKSYSAIVNATTPDQLVYNGPSRPPVFGALRNTLSYGPVSVSANIAFRLGYYFRKPSIRYGNDYGLSSQHGDYALRWQQPGDELRTQVPSVPASLISGRDDLYTYSEALVDKADNVRLQDVQISYSPAGKRSRFFKSHPMQFYVYARNLGVLWKKTTFDLDPDYTTTIPAVRTIAAGLRFTY